MFPLCLPLLLSFNLSKSTCIKCDYQDIQQWLQTGAFDFIFQNLCFNFFWSRERERNAFSLVLFNFIFNSLTWCIKSGCPLKWWVTVSEQSTHCFNTLCSALFCTYVTVEYQKEIIIIISKHKHKHTPVSCSIICKQNETEGKHVCVSVRCKSGMETGCQSIGHCFD